MRDGEHIGYYSSGLIKYKCNYLDGKLNGESIHYYESGEILSKCNYILGTIHGESIYYYESGEILSKSYHIDGESVTEFEWLGYNRNLKFKLLGL